MKHKKIFIRHTLSLGFVLAFFPIWIPFAQSFQLDQDSMQTGIADLESDEWTLQGGLTPMQTYGAASSVQMVPRGAPAYCGNSVQENGEACDGSDFGNATCSSHGFSTGNLRCTASCTVDTSGCANASDNQDDEENGAPASGGGNGGRSNAPSAESPSEQTEVPDIPVEPAVPEEVPVPEEPLETPAAETGYANGGNSGAGGDRSTRATGRTSVATGSESDGPSEAPDEPAPTKPFTSPAAQAAALGSLSVSQAGTLARLAWIARLKNIYGAIPAFA